uniref:Uncharacterized protein n=1 Tax=Lotus japonicus TaxID=34305 RepID=I3SXQ8_LOTJA|nr:unknown [Lotus japonicus]
MVANSGMIFASGSQSHDGTSIRMAWIINHLAIWRIRVISWIWIIAWWWRGLATMALFVVAIGAGLTITITLWTLAL